MIRSPYLHWLCSRYRREEDLLSSKRILFEVHIWPGPVWLRSWRACSKYLHCQNLSRWVRYATALSGFSIGYKVIVRCNFLQRWIDLNDRFTWIETLRKFGAASAGTDRILWRSSRFLSSWDWKRLQRPSPGVPNDPIWIPRILSFCRWGPDLLHPVRSFPFLKHQ